MDGKAVTRTKMPSASKTAQNALIIAEYFPARSTSTRAGRKLLKHGAVGQRPVMLLSSSLSAVGYSQD